MLGECSRHLNTQVAWVFPSGMVTLINCYFPLRNTDQLSFPAGIMWSGYTGLLLFGRCVSEDLTCSYFTEYSCVIWRLTASNYNDRFNPLRLDTTFPVKLISPATHKFPWKSGDLSEVCGFVGILGHIPFDTFSWLLFAVLWCIATQSFLCSLSWCKAENKTQLSSQAKKIRQKSANCLAEINLL